MRAVIVAYKNKIDILEYQEQFLLNFFRQIPISPYADRSSEIELLKKLKIILCFYFKIIDVFSLQIFFTAHSSKCNANILRKSSGYRIDWVF